eukprot:scaffold102641_cov26-Tisochrysis_lutea.AAC.1
MPGCQQRGPSRQIYHNYVPSHPVLTALSAPGKLFRAEYEEREPGDRDGVALLGGGGDDLTGGVGTADGSDIGPQIVNVQLLVIQVSHPVPVEAVNGHWPHGTGLTHVVSAVKGAKVISSCRAQLLCAFGLYGVIPNTRIPAPRAVRLSCRAV